MRKDRSLPACEGCPRQNESRGPYRDDVRGRWCGTKGDPGADIAIIGEFPRKDDLMYGEPFTGEAGVMIRKALSQVGRRIEDTFLTNAVQCYPLGAQDKVTPEQKAACFPRTRALLKTLGARVLIPLGSAAFECVTGWGAKDSSALAWGGYPIEPGTCKTELSSTVRWVLGSFHPAFVMRQGFGPLPRFRRHIWRAARLVHGEPKWVTDPGQSEIPSEVPEKVAFDIETAGFYGDIRRTSLAWK